MLSNIQRFQENQKPLVVLFNGTNKEDEADPTRVGLRAASEYSVASPINTLTKADVRSVALALGLPNFNYAASPCLRSRLALGVPATDQALQRVEAAETYVRRVLPLTVAANLRVRTLAKQKAVIEVDEELLDQAVAMLGEPERKEIIDLGFNDLEIRSFRSGSVSQAYEVQLY